jgi:hypothetical protein
MPNYKSIFERVEKVLLDEASKGMPRAHVQAALDEFKHIQGRRFSDSEAYRKLVHIITTQASQPTPSAKNFPR